MTIIYYIAIYSVALGLAGFVVMIGMLINDWWERR